MRRAGGLIVRSSSLARRLVVTGGLLAALICAAVAGAVPGTGFIFTVAGTGSAGYGGDGGPATAAQLSVPVNVSATPDGGYLVVEQGTNHIRRVDAAGTITTVAGNGAAGSGGDGGPATSASMNAPNAAVMTSGGDILIADSNNNRVRKVSPDGTITTVAGTGAAGFGGDGGPATAAQLSFPADVAVTADGGYLIADNDNNRIRKVSAAGTITTVAGNGTAGFSGDGGPATAAEINDPAGVAVEADGSFAIADLNNNRVRLVSATGTISTLAGTGGARVRRRRRPRHAGRTQRAGAGRGVGCRRGLRRRPPQQPRAPDRDRRHDHDHRRRRLSELLGRRRRSLARRDQTGRWA